MQQTQKKIEKVLLQLSYDELCKALCFPLFKAQLIAKHTVDSCIASVLSFNKQTKVQKQLKILYCEPKTKAENKAFAFV